jgi:cytochrome c oxidase cbb3-type subunit 2
MHALMNARKGAALVAACTLAATLPIVVAQTPLAAQPPAPTPSGTDQRGKSTYEERCVECHGESGRGDGPGAPLLTPRPRDFTAAKYKLRSTETGSLPTDDDLIRSVENGLAGSAMPGWKGLLSDAEIRDVVAYLKTFSRRFADEQPQVVALGAPVAVSPASIDRGVAVYEKLQCSKCHGTDGRGTGAVAVNFEDDWRQPLPATDLTEPWTFHGGSEPRDIYMRFRTGMSGTPMPSFKDSATDAEMWDLANYVTSLGRKPVWSMTAEEVAALYARDADEARRNPVKRGKYLVESRGCAICHSPVDEDERILPGMKYAGGQLMRVGPFGDYPTGNLTSDRETGLGSWSDDEIKQVLTRGILRDGTRLPPFPMPWTELAAMTHEDIDAIVAYLRTIPPVRNRVPAPSRPILPAYLWGKFQMLVLGEDLPVVIYAGNAGVQQ